MVIDMDIFSFFYMLKSSYAAPYVKDAFFLPLNNFSSFVENQVFIGFWVNIQGSSAQFHWITSLFLCQYQPVFITVAHNTV